MDGVMRIPLLIPESDGIPCLEVRPHEFGDDRSVTIQLPPECNGKVSLPRALLREMAAWGEGS